jgi:hypothetical protein
VCFVDYFDVEFRVNSQIEILDICVDKNRGPRAGRLGGMFNVPDDVYRIGSVDPATTGFASIIVGGVSPQAPFKRYVYDCWNIKHPTPEELKNRIKAATIEFGIQEWRIEKTGLLTMFTQDYELNMWLNARGVRLTQHYTGKNKFDVNFGVASMSPLFGTWQDMDDGSHKLISEPLIELPRVDTDGMRALVQQLTIWTPELDPKKTPCDMVMALWFFEIGCREKAKFVGGPQRRQFSGLVSPQERKKAGVIKVNDWLV